MVAAAQRRERVALLLMREGGGMSLCRPSSEYVSCPAVRRQIDRLPSCDRRYRDIPSLVEQGRIEIHP